MDNFVKDSVCSDMKFSLPATLLKVVYDSVDITPGQILTPTQAQNMPSLEWNVNPDSFYTIIMNDPDAPSRENPKFREYHHFLMVNIKGNDLENGDVLTPYIGAGPPKNTGLHRYVFLVYLQQGHDSFEDAPRLGISGEGRPSHCAQTFADKYKLEGPIAGNFFQAEYDDYVPLLHKKMSGK